MILTVTLNAAVDYTLLIDGLKAHDTNRVREIQTDAGGKGVNLSRIVRELGGETVATGFVGGEPGDYVLHRLDKQRVPHQFIETQAPTRTNFNVESGDGPPTTFNAPGSPITSAEFSAFADLFRKLCAESRWVALGGSIPPGLPTDILSILVRYAREQGCLTAVDADGEAMRCAMEVGPDLIKPNLAEAARLLGHPVDADSASDSARELVKQLKAAGASDPIAIISMGSKGAIACRGDRCIRALPIQIEPHSTIGSGDGMVAGFLTEWIKTEDLVSALRMGNAAGAATALTDGSRIGKRPEILELLERSEVEPA